MVACRANACLVDSYTLPHKSKICEFNMCIYHLQVQEKLVASKLSM